MILQQSQTMRIRLFAFFVALSVSNAALPSARAEPSDAAREERRAAYRRGIEAMGAQNWAEARRIFRGLWEEQQTWDVAFSLGQAELNLKQYRDAAEHLNIGLNSYPLRDKPEVFHSAKGWLAQAKEHVCTLKVTVNQSGANVLVDGTAVGSSPLPFEVFLEPGQYMVEARLDGFTPVRQEIVAQPGKEQAVELLLQKPGVALAVRQPPPSLAQPAPGQAPEAVVRSRDYTLAYVTGTVAVLGLATGITGFLVASDKDSARETGLDRLSQERGGWHPCGRGMSQVDECHELSDLGSEARTWRTVGWAGFGTAIAAGLATVYLVWPRDDDGQKLGVRVVAVPSVTDRNLFTGLAGTF